MSLKPRQSESKLFYRIGEVSRLTGLEPYVLRYWESEFPHLKPQKGESKQRIYSKDNVDQILLIKKMLYVEGYTIAGAKKKLNSRKDAHAAAIIETAKKELKEILEILKD